MKTILKGIVAIVKYNHMRKILNVNEKSCIPIRKISQLLYTIYRKWLPSNEPTIWKVDEVCPLNFSLVWQIMIDQEVIHDQAQSWSTVGQFWSTVRRVYRKEKSTWRSRQIMIDRWKIMIDKKSSTLPGGTNKS